MSEKDIIISEKIMEIDSLSITKEASEYIKKESAKLLERFYSEGLSKPVIYSSEVESGFMLQKDLNPLEGYVLKYYKLDRVISDAFVNLNKKCGMSEELDTSIELLSNSKVAKETVLDAVGLKVSSSIGSKYRSSINKDSDKSISGLIGTLLVMQQYDVNEDMLKNTEKIKRLARKRDLLNKALDRESKSFLLFSTGLNIVIGFTITTIISYIMAKLTDINFTYSFLAAFILYVVETVQVIMAHKLCNDIIPDVPYIINDVDVIKVSTVGELGSNSEREIVPLALSTILMSGLTDRYSSIFSRFTRDTKRYMMFTNRFLEIYTSYRLTKRYLMDIVTMIGCSYVLIVILSMIFNLA